MGNSEFTITREIGIDAAHRVPLHGSGCRRLHGHRYRIEAVCSGRLISKGEQSGMVLDFGFLKQEMMDQIHTPCDHATILSLNDPLLERLAPALNMDFVHDHVRQHGHFLSTNAHADLQLYIIPDVPTAENLARHWYSRLADRVLVRSSGSASLTRIIVHETPNCSAYYPG